MMKPDIYYFHLLILFIIAVRVIGRGEVKQL
jgi:hypothetical protein